MGSVRPSSQASTVASSRTEAITVYEVVSALDWSASSHSGPRVPL